MHQIDLIGRSITGALAIAFVCAGIFDVLDYFIVKFLLFGTFIIVAIYILIQLLKSKNHPKT